MTNPTVLFLVATLAGAAMSLSGCGDDANNPDASSPDASTPDATPPIDAVPANVTCQGQTPANIPQSITLSGKTANALNNSAVAGVTVEVRNRADDSVIASTTSGTDGTYSITFDIGGVAFDGYLAALKDTFVPAYLDVGKIYGDFAGVDLPVQTPDQVSDIATLSGMKQNAGKTLLIASVADCDMASVEGAAIAFTPNEGTIVYFGTSGLPDTTINKTSKAGVGVIFNAAPGGVTLNVNQDSINFTPLTVKTFADSITISFVRP